MGDRGNIVIKDGNDDAPVWLYGHWAGHGMAAMLRTALKREQRWGDAPYLARIVFCEMIKGDEGGETGFGIATRLCDNEYPILVVDASDQTVHVASEELVPLGEKIPIKKFIEQDNDPRDGVEGF